MDQIIVRGGKKLRGSVKISGSKNSSLPVFVASLLTNDVCVLDNVPNLEDVNTMKKLLIILHKLVDDGNTVIVIEHNLDVVKQADNIIDLGPHGGDNGGKIIYQGTPENIVKNRKSFTGKYLLRYI